ncbi:galanin receptor type 1 [Hemiscyllium ocellatum]|uniref:galanin receptor type 1 n=1 Tax=Hemiscyllium ocellatum TaxID=170820 RepID=UPI00296779B8|nr:galanin receptor type 1 [Hemiscyllium ocellatum]
MDENQSSIESNETAAGESAAGEQQQISVDSFIVLFIFSLIFCLGVLGNSLVITVLARSTPGKALSTTNIFILNLSIADLSYLLFCIPFQATYYVLPRWIFGGFICKFVHYFFTVSVLVSIFTLSAMAVDRYIAIVHSRKSSCIRVSRNAVLSVIFIWLLSLATASPVAYYHMLIRKKDQGPFCWENWSVLSHRQIYKVATFVVGYLLPLLLICYCYAKVLNHLHKKLRNMSKKSETSKKKTAQTVLVVIVVFCVSWLPNHVINLWTEFGSFPLTDASFAFRIAAHCLAYSNSSVNPIIYAFLSENFRKSYQQVFKCKIRSTSPLNDGKEYRTQSEVVPSTSCTNV